MKTGDIIDICLVREDSGRANSCKDCICYGTECNRVKHHYKADRPSHLDYRYNYGKLSVFQREKYKNKLDNMED